MTAIDRLGQHLMERVRDRSIDETYRRMRGELRRSQHEWIKTLQTLNSAQTAAVERLVRVHTDQVLAELLAFVEETREVKLLVVAADGEHDANELSDDLSAVIHGKEGWIAKFSRHEAEGL